jgi:TolB-like protein/DNA-binding SARP family transcriptional activator/Tfp pilus assembly protein PilF
MSHLANRPIIELRVLGQLDLRASDGREFSSILSQPKRVALLTYLAIRQPYGFHLRDTLLGLFWPELDQEHARGALRQALTFLRRELGEGVVATRNDEAVGLARGKVWCDATEFEEALKQGEPERAVGQYGGSLLEGFFVREAPEFEQWLDMERDRLVGRYAQALETLAGEATGRGKHKQAVDWWRRLAAVDPYGSRAAVGLIEALDAAGERASALKHARVYEARLREELDVDPDPGVTALTERLHGGAAANGTVTASAAGPEQDVELPPRPLSASGMSVTWWKAVVLVAVIVFLAALGWRILVTERNVWPPQADHDRSIVILPFENLGGDSTDQYFGRGIAEDIAIQLYALDSMRVVAPSMVGRYATGDHTLAEMGHLLGTGRILQGTVRRQTDRIRITARLMESRSGELLWGDTYDREYTDIFEIQADITARIAESLQLALFPNDPRSPTDPPTANVAAYDYYLLGRDRYHRLTYEDAEAAIQFFQNAIALDSEYALAWAGLARALAYTQLDRGGPSAVSSADRVDTALAAARRAIALDENLAEAHYALGFAYSASRESRQAARAYQRAIELEPSHFAAINNLAANVSHNSGEPDRALALGMRAYSRAPLPLRGICASVVAGSYVRLDDLPAAERWMTLATELLPDYPHAWGNFAWVNLAQGRYEEAHQKAQAALALVTDYDTDYPVSPTAMVMLGAAGDVALFRGDFNLAKEYYLQAIQLLPAAQWNTRSWGRMLRVSLALVYQQEGRQDEARQLLDESFHVLEAETAQGHHGPQPLYLLATIHAIRGEKQDAYAWLQRAIDAGWCLYRIGLQDPLLANLREDQRFQGMMADVKAKVDSMRALAQEG